LEDLLIKRIREVFTVSIIIGIAAVVACAEPPANVPAFPGAEGAGKYARGGRGGDVYHVTSLKDSGPGSLREALMTAQGGRTIVFDVAGTIQLKTRLRVEKKANITIAGQTAPGKGITIRDWPLQIYDCRDVVVRYLRVRLGDENKPKGGEDVMTVDRNQNLVLDHLSLSWGIDGNSDYRGNSNMTLQWLIYSEALNRSIHEKGPHAMCTSIRDCKGNTSVHHNIYATSRHRHPTLGSGSAKTNPEVLLDFRNCVNYNWSGPTNIGGMRINIVGNYYRPGPLTDIKAQPMQMKDGALDKARGFTSGNYFEGFAKAFNSDNFATVLYTNEGSYASTTRERWAVREEFPTGDFGIPTQTAEVAYEACLRYSGASLARDTVDERLIGDIRARKGKLIDSQKEVGGWDPYPEQRRPANWDTDGDGMPDAWEVKHGLDPRNPADGNAVGAGGYTNLERYLNSLIPAGPAKTAPKGKNQKD
jgi:pectate lyase